MTECRISHVIFLFFSFAYNALHWLSHCVKSMKHYIERMYVTLLCIGSLISVVGLRPTARILFRKIIRKCSATDSRSMRAILID